MKPTHLIKDTHGHNYENGEIPHAKNMVWSRVSSGPSNELGFDIYGVDYDEDDNIIAPAGIIVGIIPIDIGYVQFNRHVNNVCTITVVRNGVPTIIIQDEILGFTAANFIRGVYTYNAFGQLIICFWEGLADEANVPRILNIDCLPFEVDSDKALVDDADIVLLNQFPVINKPTIDFVTIQNGGTLLTGVYYISTAYILKDESRTMFFDTSNQISIFDESANEDYIYIDGAPAGTYGNKAIKLTFSGLDSRYYKLAVAVVKKIGGVVSAELVAELPIEGNTSLTWVYNGTQFVSSLDVSEIIVPSMVYDRVQAGAIHRNRLNFGNLRSVQAPAIQPYVNAVTLEWVYTKELEFSSYDGSYKNPYNVFYFRHWRPFAVYALYLIAHMDDGTKWAYHIPGRAVRDDFDFGDSVTDSENTDLDTLVTAGVTDPDVVLAESFFPEAKYFQLFDTADTDGTLGFWENENEVYADVECNMIKDCTGNVVGTLVGEKVRHHRMPSIKLLNDVEGDIFSTDDEPSLIYFEITGYTTDSTPPTPPIGTMTFDVLEDNTGGSGIFTNVNWGTAFVYTTPVKRTFTVSFFLDISDIDDYFYFRIRKARTYIDYDTVFEDITDMPDLDSNGTADIEDTITIELEAGESIVIQSGYSTEFGTEDTPDIDTTSWVRIASADPASFPTTAKILGVQITNLCIPSELREHIVGFELGYAERTAADNVVIDQDVIKYTDTGATFRAHPFDSLLTKQNPGMDFIRTYYKFEGAAPFIYSDRTVTSELKRVLRSQYIPTDVTEPIDNDNREEILYGVLSSGFSGVTLADDAFPDAYYLADFLRYLTDVYMDYKSLKIVRTGNVFDYSSLPTAIYGGDTFTSIYGLLISRSTPDDTSTHPNDSEQRLRNLKELLYPVMSIANIGLRHSKSTAYYFPFNTDYDNIFDPSDEDVAPTITQTTNGMEYNEDYSSVNNLELLVVVECRDDCINPDTYKFPYRIHRSLSTATEQRGNGWRVMLSNDYYEMPKNRGEIMVLSMMGDTMLIQHRFALFVAQARDVLSVANGIEVALGGGDLFGTDPTEIVPEEGGYIGCGNYYGAIVTKIGYVVADNSSVDRGKVFIYDGKLSEISNVRNESGYATIREFFRKNLYLSSIDSPYNTSGLAIAYDDANDRLLLTKHVLVANTGNSPLQGYNNFTISFSIPRGQWVSFHDYAPNHLFSSRAGFFSVFNNVLGLVYEHNVANRYGYYYNDEEDGAPIPAYVDVALVGADPEAKHLISINWKTTVINSSNKVLFGSTITHVMVYTNDMCTGLLALVTTNGIVKTANKAVNNDYVWLFTELWDITVDRDTLTIGTDGTVNNSNINSSKPFFEKSPIVSTFVVVRCYIDNVAQLSVTLEDIMASFTKALRRL